MIVRSLKDIEGTERDVRGVTNGQAWRSCRLLLKSDKMGFSFNISSVPANSEHVFEYKNHLEAVYCISGKAIIEDLRTGKRYDVLPGTIYALDKHDKHCLRAETEMNLISIFAPALVGDEKHDSEGSYPLR